MIYDLTQDSPKLKKNEQYVLVFNPNTWPVIAAENGQSIPMWSLAIVHPAEDIAKRAIEQGVLQVRSEE